MVRQEESGERDLAYSGWHRTLPNFCYMIDADSIEWRPGRGVVAIIETCRGTATVHKKVFQMKVLKEVATKLQVPFYIVSYYENLGKLTYFDVYDLTVKDWPECDKRGMTEEAYRRFIQGL